MREKIAELCHEQWSNWMNYLFSKGVFNEDNSLTLPEEYVSRWARQMLTPYSKLSKAEQDSDREEADKFLELFNDNQDSKVDLRDL